MVEKVGKKRGKRKVQINIIKQFEPLLKQNHTYYVFHSGRGAGKSYSIAQCLILLSATKPVRILCIREVQKSLNESVKALLESLIIEMNLQSLFTIKHDTIESQAGSKFLFMGMKDMNAVNVKSIANISITWIEEAEAFSKRSWDLLIPSVTRTAHPKIIISFNPRYEDDIIYQVFFKRKPPPNSYICKLHVHDNPFFKSSNLEVQRLHDLEVLPESEYKWKWEGELIQLAEECIFTKMGFARLRDGKNMPVKDEEFRRDDYFDVVVALDPATTSALASNEFGVIVCGCTKNGVYHVIADYTGHLTPSNAAILVTQLYRQFQASAVVVEVNQGGDFIKHSLLEFDARLNIVEVRATKDKIYRASPLSSLAHLGRLKLLDIFTSTDRLLQQMRSMTKRGYQGPKGSSPDALDAVAWGIHYLAGLSNSGTQATLFKNEAFHYDEAFSFKSKCSSVFTYYNSVDTFVVLIFQEVQNARTQRKLEVQDCIVYERPNMQDILSHILTPSYFKKSLTECQTIYIPDINAFQQLVGSNVYFYDVDSSSYDDKLLKILEASNTELVQFQEAPMSESQYGASRQEVLKVELSKARLGEKYRSAVLEAFYYLINQI